MQEYREADTQEALAKTQTLLDALDRMVQQSPCVQQFPDVAAAAFNAHEALIELTEAIASKIAPQDDGQPSAP